jgi:alpha-tubulin suppressor-like RCC1 family protein
VLGAARSVYCWGANDHGQVGTGTTGNGAFTSDVAQATKIETDETALPFGGIDEITAAAWHTCARKGDVLFCWGQRLTGAQGEPPADPNADRTKPRAIGNLSVKAIAAGGAHTCAVRSDNNILCFGHSYFNELGRPPTSDAPCTAAFFYSYAGVVEHTCANTFLPVTNYQQSTDQVIAGEVHSCSLANGSVYCWGGTAAAVVADAYLPKKVVTNAMTLTTLDQASAIASGGGKHTCALRAGRVLCWGANDRGQLGADPATVAQRAEAAEVAGITDATAIGVADGVSCAIRAGGTVWCWGDAQNGQLGDGGVLVDGGAASFAPLKIPGPLGVGDLTGIVEVAPGRRHVCAKKSDNTVWCWGRNDRGQLGDNTKLDSIYPVKVAGLP